ncbi:hypothetical protein HN385_07625 [archaeon]|jgi:hypothetical protein|nr:hypothetical protein [archaeon]MBT4207429.1 hypothetical protein [Candidatus Woesearchaeota archaeon]MBT4732272.1 hypothetical protein [Candidatus Woesearchaeota archaeon]MBT5758853.1 hypothetical protein [Candidatus Neomarinimicrobiota bacterium]MBT7557254.1 hypothetical protein [Candidatus Woesearchaeota archaeon]
MADAGTMFRSLPTDQKLGDYNGITKVLSSTTVEFTGSNAGAAFIVENTTNVVVHGSGGGTLPSTVLNTKTLYPIGVNKVVIGETGVVYVLHR